MIVRARHFSLQRVALYNSVTRSTEYLERVILEGIQEMFYSSPN